MTLIAAVFDKDIITFLNDALVTTDGILPNSDAKVAMFPGHIVPRDTHISRMVRKIHIFDPFSMIMWAGSVVHAREAIKKLSELHKKNADFSEIEAFEILKDYNVNDLSFIMVIGRNDELVVFHRGCDEADWPGMGKMIIGGSGSAAFQELVQPNEFGDYEFEGIVNSGNSSEEKSILKSMYLDMKFTNIQTGMKALSQRWGGAIEASAMTTYGIYQMQPMLQITSLAIGATYDYKVLPVVQIITKEIFKDNLVMRVVHPYQGEDKLFVIHGLLTDGEFSLGEYNRLPPSRFQFQCDIISPIMIDAKSSKSIAKIARNKKIFIGSNRFTSETKRKKKIKAYIDELNSHAETLVNFVKGTK